MPRRTVDDSYVGTNDAVEEWAPAARVRLLAVAQRYHATITYSELATLIQQDAGIETGTLLQNWIGKVLGPVAVDCGYRGEPVLSALCVRANGTVGPGYPDAVEDVYGYRPEDPEIHAAEERLKCYRYFKAPDLPQDGGAPALTTQERARREARQRAESPTPKRTICPRCNIELPPSDECDMCGWSRRAEVSADS